MICFYYWVEEGDPSSTLLFLSYVNYIMSNINADFNSLFTVNELKLFSLLFADDTVLFAHSATALQSML